MLDEAIAARVEIIQHLRTWRGRVKRLQRLIRVWKHVVRKCKRYCSRQGLTVVMKGGPGNDYRKRSVSSLLSYLGRKAQRKMQAQQLEFVFQLAGSLRGRRLKNPFA